MNVVGIALVTHYAVRGLEGNIACVPNTTGALTSIAHPWHHLDCTYLPMRNHTSLNLGHRMLLMEGTLTLLANTADATPLAMGYTRPSYLQHHPMVPNAGPQANCFHQRFHPIIHALQLPSPGSALAPQSDSHDLALKKFTTVITGVLELTKMLI